MGVAVKPIGNEHFHMPPERRGITHKFVIYGGDVRYDEVRVGDRILYEKKQGNLKGYLTVGFTDGGNIGEAFLTIGKMGGMYRVYDALMIAMSIGLQHGVPLDVFVSKLSYLQFEPEGITSNNSIPFAKSVVDYIARWLKQFCDDGEKDGNS